MSGVPDIYESKLLGLLNELFDESEIKKFKHGKNGVKSVGASSVIEDHARKNYKRLKGSLDFLSEDGIFYLNQIDTENIINGKLKIHISEGTVRDIYKKYLQGFVSIYKDTANILALYLGYIGWQGYIDKIKIPVPDKNIEAPSEDIFNTISQNLESLNTVIQEKLQQSQNLELNSQEIIDLISSKALKIVNAVGKSKCEILKFLPPSGKEKLVKKDFDTLVRGNLSDDLLNDLTEEAYGFIVNKYLGKKGRNNWEWYQRSTIISALSINFINRFDESKANLLIRCINERDEEKESDGIWQKALVGLIIGLLTIYNNTKKIEIIQRQLQNISYANDIKYGISVIIKELILFDLKNYVISDEYIKNKYFFQNTYRWFVPFHKNIQPLQKAFQLSEKNVNTTRFAELLSNSKSLSMFMKFRVAFRYPILKEKQINELIKILNEERHNIKVTPNESYRNIKYLIFNNITKELILSLEQINSLKSIYINIIDNISSQHETFVNTLAETTQDFSISALYYEKNKDYKKAFKYNEKIINIKPNDKQAWLNCGWWLLVCGDIKKAEPYFLRSIELGSHDYGNINLGHVYLIKKQRSKAIKHYLLWKEHCPSKARFLKEFENDYQYLKQYGIVKVEYSKLVKEISE